MIAGRGKGKSTMVRHILDKMNVKSPSRPSIGSTETTMIQCPYEIRKDFFLWDMPGLGGLNHSPKF